MQTSNFILINHDVYGKNMVSICFIYFHLSFIRRKFICLHYLDQLHLVSSHASRQMCTMYLVPSLFIIVNKTSKKYFHATFEKFLEIFVLILTKNFQCAVENFYKHRKMSTKTWYFLSYNFPKRFVFFSRISSSLYNRKNHEWKCALCHVELHNIIVFNKKFPLSLHLIVKRYSRNCSVCSRI